MEIQLKKGAYAAAAETMGGELVSLRDRNGRERIWQGDPAVWSGRNPNLFPIVGGLRNGEVDIDGTVCRMGRHGFARRKEFSVAERGEDYVVLALREDAETLEQYPFPFLFQVRHQLTETGFVTAFTVANTGDRAMPFCIGAHTAFACPVLPGEGFADYRLVFDEPEEADAPEGVRAPCANRMRDVREPCANGARSVREACGATKPNRTQRNPTVPNQTKQNITLPNPTTQDTTVPDTTAPNTTVPGARARARRRKFFVILRGKGVANACAIWYNARIKENGRNATWRFCR